MMNKIYCYHCMTYHLPENMRQIMTRTGLRWRCIRSIEAARNTAAERDAFGARQTELNRSRSLAEQERFLRESRRPDYRC
ncbi:hypothetical protein [Zoogloea sp.]|jgi:hypothetical protein|uniref:hypothetical protein n=1 Tax=Zoogloea sp. TaxID=49181 RepID=UPI0035AE6F6C